MKNQKKKFCDCNWTRTQNHLVLKRTLNHLAKLVQCLRWFNACVATLDRYLFHWIAFLKPDFNCWSSFALHAVDKVTTGTSSFVSVIANFVAWSTALDFITQFESISRILQTLLRYFKEIVISASFESLLPVFPVIFF